MSNSLELDKCTTVAEAVGVAVGAGSVCWATLEGAGEFDSTRASDVVDQLVAWIKANPDAK